MDSCYDFSSIGVMTYSIFLNLPKPRHSSGSREEKGRTANEDVLAAEVTCLSGLNSGADTHLHNQAF